MGKRKQKVVKGEDLPKGVQAQTTAKRGRQASAETTELATKILGVLETLRNNGVTETTSNVVRDKLELDKESGRDTVRRIMRSLADQGKVVIGEKVNGKKKQYVFSLKSRRRDSDG